MLEASCLASCSSIHRRYSGLKKSDNIDSLMGTNPKIVVFNEYALQNHSAWHFISPILKVNGGTAIFISTPRGKNHFYELYNCAKSNPEWHCEKLTIEDTGVLTKADVDKEIAEGMSEELAQQEYMVSFDRGVEGSGPLDRQDESRGAYWQCGLRPEELG